MHPIRRHRLEKGWTQTDLAQQVGVTLNAVVAWEKGATPRPRLLPKMAGVFDVPTAQLVAEIEQWQEADEGKDAAA